jgi:hypothetical protein
MVPEKTGEPLLIEWNGDSYQQVGSAGDRNVAGNKWHQTRLEPERRSAASQTPEAAPQTAAAEPGPVVLVYRDGHRETVAEYSIVGRTLYAVKDYWQSGSWTRPIPLITVDVPATIAASRAAGGKFLLPSGPNVVVASF